MTTPRGKKFQTSLNVAQRQAVETIEGPVMVIAGPGTGKTHTLTSRIAHILEETDTPPDGILALTFTEAAASEMRERLQRVIGPTAYYVNIQTFHAFCSDIIRSNPDAFPSAQSLEPLSELERITLMREIIDSGGFSAIHPHGAPYLYIPSLITAIGNLKREGISPGQLEKIIAGYSAETSQDTRYLKRNQELVAVYQTYQDKLKTRGRYDFEDMINLVVETFRTNDELLLSYQQRFLYFLVDEYQDTNAAQNQLLMLLASYWKDQANLFVVGDDDQAIFRFQGASVENILTYHDAFPRAALVTLNENYRSIQPILDAAHGVISRNNLSLAQHLPQVTKLLRAKTPLTPRKITVGRFSSGATEQFFVAKKIQELIASGTPASDIAVIYRHNIDGAELAEMLSRLSVPYDIEGGQDILTDPDVQKLLLLMRAVLGVRRSQEGVDLFTLLNYPFLGCHYLDVLKLSRFASDRKMNLWEALSSSELSQLALTNPDRLTQVYELLGQLQQDEAEGPFVLFFEKLIHKSGFLSWCLRSPSVVDKLNAVNSLFAEIKRLNTTDHTLNLEKFLDTVDLMISQRISISEEDLDIRGSAVALITAHRAKGREFGVVFIFRASDGKWGNNAMRELIKLPDGILTKTDLSRKEKNEDERRLFYVAMTRAKQQLYITSAETYSTSWGRRESVETMFLSEIPPEYVEQLDVAPYEREVREILETLLTPVPDDAPSEEERTFLKQTITTLKLSPTALNTYLACPYKFKLNNLLRAPRAKSMALSYGSAIHKALELFFREYKQTRTLPDVAAVKRAFTHALQQEILTDAELERLSQRGLQALTAYVEFYKKDLAVPTDVERFFGYGFSKTILGAIPLSGKIDKIEPIDATGKLVRVVDYKTGRPKSRSEIEGKTAQANGDYKRQLVFYYLLAELDKHFAATVAEAELDFVEPDRQTGSFKKERFTISAQEVAQLKETITRVWADILALKFSRTKEVRKNCDRCEWKLHCWPDGLPYENEQLSLLSQNM